MNVIDVAQWFFDLEKIAEGFNWPISVSGMIEAKQGLDQLLQSKATAEDVVAAYKKFAGAIGPTVMNILLESDDAFPEVNHSDRPTPPAAGKVTLYVDPKGQRVLAESTKEWGMAPIFSVA